MKTQINWGKLLAQNRVKDIGIRWSKEEEEALKKGISPDDVRAGILSKKDSKSVKGNPLFRMKKSELMKKAEGMSIDFDKNSVTRSTLIHEISEKRS